MMLENIFLNMQSTIVFIFVLSVLIVVHEWGHFIAAKAVGVDVEVFSLGFGPKLFSKFYKGTEFMLCLIPLGGYVKMAGDERSECTGKPGEFYSKSPWRRSLIALNGPVINVVLAYACLISVFIIGYPGFSTRIEEVVDGGPAQKAGLLIGDKIIEINSRRIYGWRNLENRIAASSSPQIEVKVLRGQKEIIKLVNTEIVNKPNLLGEYRDVPDIGIGSFSNMIGAVSENSPAMEAGLEVGDKIIKVDSKDIHNWTELKEGISNSVNNNIELRIIRDGKEIIEIIAPSIVKRRDSSGEEKKIKQIGIAPAQNFDTFKFNFVESVRNAHEKLMEITVMTYKSLYFMVTGFVSAREAVTGPIGIFFIIKIAAEMGLAHLLLIVGVISISLAIFNLLPIIPLDGGHLFLLGIEKIRKRALPEKVDNFIARIGFGLIISLAMFVFYSDFSRYGWIENIMKMFP